MDSLSIKACGFEVGKILTVDQNGQGKAWHRVAPSKNEDNTSIATCVFSKNVLRIAPEHQVINHGKRNIKRSKNRTNKSFRWKSLHFNDDLTVPGGNYGVLLFFEAMARECLTIGLSASSSYSHNKTFYQIILGATGNTRTVISTTVKDNNNKNKSQPQTSMTSAPGRVCQEKTWMAYWIALNPNTGIVYVGVGTIPGEQCIAIHDPANTTSNNKSDEAESRTDVEETKEKGNDEEDDGEEEYAKENNEDDSDHDDQKPAAVDVGAGDTISATNISRTRYFVGIANSAVMDRQAPTPIKVRNIKLTSLPIALADELSMLQNDDVDMILLDDQDNISDDNNQHQSSHTKALLQEYKEECDKARARAAKFGVPYKEPAADAFIPWSEARRLKANPSTGFVTGMDLQDPVELAKIEARKKRFAASAINTGASDITTELDDEGKQPSPASGESGHAKGKGDNVEVEQAWDNEIFVKRHRMDPPGSLWKSPVSDANGVNQAAPGTVDDVSATWVYEKIHIFSIDWSAFKQIRTNDIMSYFAVYGPSYVEWLGDLSCNIHFQDKFSAARAYENLSVEIPSTPATDISERAHDTNNNKGSVSRSDLGNMGWRLGKTMLRKVANDKYGRRGTKARLLMRYATSRDILQNRPSSWPKPPPGFSTTRVLGPGSDDYETWTKNKKKNIDDNVSAQQQLSTNKKKRNRSGRENNNHGDGSRAATGGEPLLLHEALSAGRDGFTVEEMEAERAKKKTKAATG